ncbi:MAG: GNAT family N-acetyltransferase [Burkholderiaceae bacterium]
MNAPLSNRQLAAVGFYQRQNLPGLAQEAVSEDRYQLLLAQSKDDLRMAQRLRFDVFTQEYQAQMPSRLPGIDEDYYDAFCDHLLVRDNRSDEVVGTYRILPPHQAKAIGGYYSETEFFINRLDRMRDAMVELGRSCVHPDHRNGAVIMLLWSGIAAYMRHYGYRYLIGCASVTMRDGGRSAAHIWDIAAGSALAPAEDQGFPKHPLPLDRILRDETAQLPPLLKGYLRVGAKVCSPPSWDPDFNSADFLMLLRLSDTNPRYARHFGLGVTG